MFSTSNQPRSSPAVARQKTLGIVGSLIKPKRNFILMTAVIASSSLKGVQSVTFNDIDGKVFSDGDRFMGALDEVFFF